MNKIFRNFLLTIFGAFLFATAALTTMAVQQGQGLGDFFGGDVSMSAGTVTGPSGTWDSGGVDIATTDTYAIASTDVLTATTLGTAVVNSSLTAFGVVTSGTMGTGSVIGTPTMTLGSDADGDIYFRNSGILTRLAKGSDTEVLTLASGIPSWAAAGGGSSNASTTVKGIVEIATAAEQGSQTGTGATGAIVVVAASNTVKGAVFTSAVLTGGTSATSVAATYASVSDGSVKIIIDGVAYSITAIDFTGDSDMDDVAATIQAKVRTATSALETVVWSTDHFILSSVNLTASSEISKCTAGASGTDISGVGGTTYMDCDGANGSIANAALNAGENNAVLALSTGFTDTNLSAYQGVEFRRNRTIKRYGVGSDFIAGTAAPFANQTEDDQGTVWNNTCAGTDNNVAGVELTFLAGSDTLGVSVHAKNPKFWIPARFSDTTAQEGFIGYVNSDFSGTLLEDGAMTVDHFGFIIQNGSILISVADGSTQASTDISGIAGAANAGKKYEATFDGTTAKFFVNGSPVGHLTANVPDGDLSSFIASVIADSSAGAKIIRVDKEGFIEYDE